MERPTDTPCTLGIDIGTTSAKVIAVTDVGEYVAEERYRLETIHEEDGWAEQDPHAVYRAIMTALSSVSDKLKLMNIKVSQVGFSAAMHSVLPVSQDGQPLGRAMIWMDKRARGVASDLWNTPEGKNLYKRTGTPVHPMTMVVKLMWLRQNNPELHQAAHKFVSLKEWIWFEWFGEWVIDESMASTTGLYNIHERTWDAAALDMAGVSATKLGRVVPTTYSKTDVRNSALTALVFTDNPTFNIGATDGVLANLGVGAMSPDAMVLTIGTSCAVRLTSRVPKTDVDSRLFCYVLDSQHYVLGGPSNSGGITIEGLYRMLFSDSDEKWNPDQIGDILREAESVETGNLVCLPYLTGERAPLWNADATAAWFGLGIHHTRVHLMKAAVEGVIFNAYWIASRLIQATGKPEKIMASGQLLEVEWIRQLTADVFGIEVHFIPEGDASATGAIWLAEMAAGKRTPGDRASTRPHADVVRPHLGRHTEYMEKFQLFQRVATVI